MEDFTSTNSSNPHEAAQEINKGENLSNTMSQSTTQNNPYESSQATSWLPTDNLPMTTSSFLGNRLDPMFDPYSDSIMTNHLCQYGPLPTETSTSLANANKILYGMDCLEETYSYQNHVNNLNDGLQDKDSNIKNRIQIRLSIAPKDSN